MPSFYKGTGLKSDPYSCKQTLYKATKKPHHSLLGLFFINYFEVAICLVIWTKQSNGLRYGLIYLCKVFLLSSIGCTLATRLGGTRTFSGQLDVGARILIQRTYITRDSYLMKGFWCLNVPWVSSRPQGLMTWFLKKIRTLSQKMENASVLNMKS